MKTTTLVAGAIASAALFATSSAQASSWDTYADAEAFAVGYAPGSTQIQIQDVEHLACNGSPIACAPLSAGRGNTPFTYTHSDTQTFARLAANTAGYSAFPGGPPSGYAYAYADLAKGQVHLFTVASSGQTAPLNGAGSAGYYADASFMDTLHFAVATPTPITVKLHIEGDYDVDFDHASQPIFSFALSDANTVLATEGHWADGSHNYVGLDGFTTTYDAYATYGTWTAYGPEDFVGTFTVDPRYPDITVSMDLFTVGLSPSFVDFSDGAALSLDLPAGVTFTSDSGAFLTAASGTPEPAAWMMLIAGFGAVGAAARRRSAAEA